MAGDRWFPGGDVPTLLTPPTISPADATASHRAAILTVGPDARPTPLSLGDAHVQRSNYVARHWRGDLSLGVSYWINGWLASVGYYTTVLLPVIALNEENSLPFAISGLIADGLGIALRIWQLTGLWRSAEKHTGRGGRRVWARAAQATVIFGWYALVVSIFRSLGLPRS
jgi:hypothetical protein